MDTLDINQIKKLLPHRYPFLLVDKVISYERFKSLVAIKNVTLNEPHFTGHFPGKPIMPGVLIIESMAQAAALLGAISLEESPEGALYYLVGVDHVRFKHPVEPGDQLILNAEFVKVRRNIWKFKTTAMVNNELIASAEILTTVKEPDS